MAYGDKTIKKEDVMKIISFTVSQLTNGSQFAFIQAIIKAARKCEAIVTNAKKQLELLEHMFAVEDDVMLRHAKSPFTEKISKLDAERDRIYSMIRAICKAMREMMDADRKQAATEVFDVIAAYGWISTYKYDRQTGMLENLCQDLQGPHAQLVAQLGLTEAVAHLKETNDAFAAAVAERSEAKGPFVKGEMAAARQDTEQAYFAFVDVVNSLSTLFMAGGGTAAENPYAEFIAYVNNEINRLKISELRQKTRSEEAESILSHQFGWNDPADGTDPDYPTTPPTTEPSNPGGGTNEPTTPPAGGGSGSTTPRYTITYMHNGQVYATQEYEVGATVTPPTPPAGYYWMNRPSTMPARNVTCTSYESGDLDL